MKQWRIKSLRNQSSAHWILGPDNDYRLCIAHRLSLPWLRTSHGAHTRCGIMAVILQWHDLFSWQVNVMSSHSDSVMLSSCQTLPCHCQCRCQWARLYTLSRDTLCHNTAPPCERLIENNAVLMLARRHRRRASIKTALLNIWWYLSLKHFMLLTS